MEIFRGEGGAISSVTQSCPTLCHPMDCSTPGLPVHHQLPEFAQTHVHRVGDAVQPSHPLSSPSPAFSLCQHQSFPRSQFFTSGGQSIGVSASASILPMNIGDWFDLAVQFNSVQSLSRVRLCNPMNRSTPGLPVHHQLPEFTQTRIHRVGDAIQPSHPLSSPSPALNPSQHQSLFQ